MLEIIVLYYLCSSIGRTAQSKGLTAWPYQLMLVLFWFGGEVMGVIAGAVLLAGSGGPPVLLYGCALGGAVLGVVLAFAIANSQADERQPPQQERGPREGPFADEGRLRDAQERWGDAQNRARDAQERTRDDQDRIDCRDCGTRFLAVLDACPKCRLPASDSRLPPTSDQYKDR
jgi:hypothetical protein